MDIIYRLDKIIVKQTVENQFIVIYGYIFDKKGRNVNLQLKINNEVFLYKKVGMLRKDIALRYENYSPSIKCGFRIQSDSLDNIDIKKVELSAIVEDESDILLELDDNSLKKYISKTTLEYNVDSITWNDSIKMNCSIRGYSYSLLKNKNLKFSILDKKGNEIESSFILHNREDLFNLGIVNEENKYCGFEIKFIGERTEAYYLSISNGVDVLKVDLNGSRRGFIYRFLKQIMHFFHLQRVVKGLKYVKKYGLRGLINRIRRGSNIFGTPYGDWFELNKVSEDILHEQEQTAFDYEPVISIIVPTYNTPLQFLHEMIDSVLKQSYKYFELCIADGSTDKKVVDEIKKYAQKDNRIKYVLLDKNYGISGNTNKALELATGDYVGLFDHDDLLTPDCLFEVVKSLQDKKHDIIYTDEDKTDTSGKIFKDPNFKPDFNVDLFYSHNYITHFFVVKREIINGVGAFRSECDGAQDYDVMFRCIEQADSIHHIPKILYHWRMHEASTAENPESKMYCYEAGRKAIQDHYDRVGIKAKVEIMKLWGMYHTIYDTPQEPLISIVIPNKDEKETLCTCIKSLFEVSEYKNFEIIVVENNSSEQETFTYYKELEQKYHNVKVVYWDKEFNYSAINNYGVSFAKGEYILLLNNDTEMINKEALREMLGLCMREDVGIVGAKLLYHDDTVQHAGIVIGFGGFAGHVFTGIDKSEYGYMVRAQINCDYSAVTAACLMTKRCVFDEVGGLSEDFKVGLNDVDYCLKVRETGKLVVFNAFSLWHHYESKSRGYEDTPEKVKRFEGEIALFQKKWKKILVEGDPYYNKNFPIEYGPFKLG